MMDQVIFILGPRRMTFRNHTKQLVFNMDKFFIS